jgi:hypothetical protein
MIKISLPTVLPTFCITSTEYILCLLSTVVERLDQNLSPVQHFSRELILQVYLISFFATFRNGLLLVSSCISRLMNVSISSS